MMIFVLNVLLAFSLTSASLEANVSDLTFRIPSVKFFTVFLRFFYMKDFLPYVVDLLCGILSLIMKYLP